MYVVIFTAKTHDLDERYPVMAQNMRALALSKYGCEAFNALTENDTEIAVSYWPSLQSIQEWKKDIAHLEVQALGKQKWYSWYKVDVAKIERSYEHSGDD